MKEIEKYAGDHIFMVVSNDRNSLRAMQQLESSQIWSNLPAVQNGQVYKVSTDWLMEDSISLLGQLRDTLQIMKL